MKLSVGNSNTTRNTTIKRKLKNTSFFLLKLFDKDFRITIITFKEAKNFLIPSE